MRTVSNSLYTRSPYQQPQQNQQPQSTYTQSYYQENGRPHSSSYGPNQSPRQQQQASVTQQSYPATTTHTRNASPQAHYQNYGYPQQQYSQPPTQPQGYYPPPQQQQPPPPPIDYQSSYYDQNVVVTIPNKKLAPVGPYTRYSPRLQQMIVQNPSAVHMIQNTQPQPPPPPQQQRNQNPNEYNDQYQQLGYNPGYQANYQDNQSIPPSQYPPQTYQQPPPYPAQPYTPTHRQSQHQRTPRLPPPPTSPHHHQSHQHHHHHHHHHHTQSQYQQPYQAPYSSMAAQYAAGGPPQHHHHHHHHHHQHIPQQPPPPHAPYSNRAPPPGNQSQPPLQHQDSGFGFYPKAETVEEKATRARAVFRKFDGDLTGFLDIYEFMAAMKHLGAPMSFEDAKAVFGIVDTDGSFSMEEEEFVKHFVQNY